MKIQIASDLHAEFKTDTWKLENAGADVLILAGDIVCLEREPSLKTVLEYLAPKWKHVIYVAGNHEFYGSNLWSGTSLIRDETNEIWNFRFLDNEWAKIDGVNFYGGTGWFPDRENDPMAWHSRFHMNDFRLIEHIARDAPTWNNEFVINLEKNLVEPDIIISHHLPHKRCISERFQNIALNAYFLADFDDLVETVKPKLWVYGHSHDTQDFKIGRTRLVNNACGYPREQNNSHNNFRKDLVIEI